MNLAENRGSKFLFVVFDVVFENNTQHVVHAPAYSASCYCVIEFRLEVIHGYSARQIIKCTVTP